MNNANVAELNEVSERVKVSDGRHKFRSNKKVTCCPLRGLFNVGCVTRFSNISKGIGNEVRNWSPCFKMPSLRMAPPNQGILDQFGVGLNLIRALD